MERDLIKKKCNKLPHSVCTVQDIRNLERTAINVLGMKPYELMQRAGMASYELARTQWPKAKNWLILCGHGNNGGDGYIIAQLAHISGIKVRLIECQDYKVKSPEAKQARNAWLFAGGVINGIEEDFPNDIDLIIDALLGIGINRAPTDSYNQLIKRINAHDAPVLAIDIPSGLMAETGTIPGTTAVIAERTISMIALKPGQLIGKARDHIGHLHYHDLGLKELITSINIPIVRYDVEDLSQWIKPRRNTLHKGDNGRLLLIGGDIGMGGAIKMTAEAALRSGAGIVSILTHEYNVYPILTTRPELMVNVLTKEHLDEEIKKSDVIIVGPGLGKKDWAKQALKIITKSKKPMVWDADALNLLAMDHSNIQNRIITPHIGEASRLLGLSKNEIEKDLLYSVKTLVNRYGGVTVLKSAGAIIASITGEIAIADVGNAGMASGGMGDVLSGIIGGFLGQKMTLIEASCTGCIVHGATADMVAHQRGMRGMLATDLFELIWKFVNPDMIKHKI